METVFFIAVFLLTDHEKIYQNIKYTPEAVVQEHSVYEQDGENKKILEIEEFFNSYGSPLALYAKDFFKASKSMQLDYRLLPAISMVESTGGKATPSCADYNPFGWSDSSSPCNYRQFENFSEAITTVAKGIGRGKSYAEFRETKKISDIAKKYNPGNSEKWARDVEFFINKF